MDTLETTIESKPSLPEPVIMTDTETGVPILVTHQDCEVRSLEGLLSFPKFIRDTPVFTDCCDFTSYVTQFAAAQETRVYADEDKYRVTAVLDGASGLTAGHSQHLPRLSLQLASEWKQWASVACRKLSRQAFTTFIEHHLEDIVGSDSAEDELTGSTLLEMCRGIRGNTSTDLSAEESGSGNERSLVVGTRETMNSKINGEEVPFPRFIFVKLPVFRNCDEYKFKAFLRWEIQDGDLAMTIDLIDPELVQERAFKDVIDNKLSGLPEFVPVYRGAFSRSEPSSI